MNQPTHVYQYAGEMLSETELECPLPPSPLSPNSSSAVYTWNISVSNDGQTYSNHLQLTVYDSRCLDCQCGGECQQKVNNTIISTNAKMFCYWFSVLPMGRLLNNLWISWILFAVAGHKIRYSLNFLSYRWHDCSITYEFHDFFQSCRSSEWSDTTQTV